MEETSQSRQEDDLVRVFIQARMSSNRFPGKVLAPFHGRPLIAQVVHRVSEALPLEQITVLTSLEESDDPLALYVAGLGCGVFRGPLADVFSRFQLCLREYPCDWFIRISADSPLMDSRILSRALEYRQRTDLDLVTNVFPRTYPKGHSCEMVRSSIFAALDAGQLTPEEKEHVTKVFYAHSEQYNILNFESGQDVVSDEGLAIDTLEDYYRLQKKAAAGQEGV